MQRLRELGWIEGRTVAIDYRWAEGRGGRMAEIAAEFVGAKVDLIFAGGTEAALAAKKATALIPIVFPIAGDPVGAGMVASLARPGGNVTGLSNLAADLTAKRLEILRDVFPGLDRLAIMANVGDSQAVLQMRELQRRPPRSASKLFPWKSGALRISRPHSSRSKAARMRSTLSAIRS